MKDKQILITGATNGVGLAVAEALTGVAAHPLRRGRLLLPAPWACEAMYLSWL